MFINVHIIPSHWRTCQTVSILSYVWGFGVMRVQQLIVGWFKQAFHKMFAKQCRILHTSRKRKRRRKDRSCARAPSVGLVIVVPHCWQLRNKSSDQSHVLAKEWYTVDSQNGGVTWWLTVRQPHKTDFAPLGGATSGRLSYFIGATSNNYYVYV